MLYGLLCQDLSYSRCYSEALPHLIRRTGLSLRRPRWRRRDGHSGAAWDSLHEIRCSYLYIITLWCFAFQFKTPLHSVTIEGLEPFPPIKSAATSANPHQSLTFLRRSQSTAVDMEKTQDEITSSTQDPEKSVAVTEDRDEGDGTLSEARYFHIDEETQKRVVRKLDWNIMPIVIALCMLLPLPPHSHIM